MQVNGPIQSALNPIHGSQLVTTDSAADEPSSNRTDERFEVLDTSVLDSGVLPSNLPPWHPNAVSASARSLDIPLTYDDLALPIDPPPPIAQRFNATVPIRQQQLEQERVSALVMPAMEQLAVKQQIELQRVAESVRKLSSQQHDSKAAGSLASSRDRSVERLPKVAPVDRDRHWIRQPE